MDEFYRKLHESVKSELAILMKDKYYGQGITYSSPEKHENDFTTMRVFLNCFKTSTKEAVQLLAYFPYDNKGNITNSSLYEKVMPVSKDIVTFQITKIRDIYNDESRYPSIILGTTLVGHRMNDNHILYSYNENENMGFLIGEDCKLV